MWRIFSALGIGAMASTASAQDGYYGKYETPRYEVVRQVGAAEVRNYASYVVAEVAVRGEQSRALGQGFRALAGYIFGGNDGGASVAMTAPVTQTCTNIAMTAPVTQTQDGDVWAVTFMMPTEFGMNTLPAPNNEAVRFVEVPARSMLVVSFSGRAPTRVLDARSAQIIEIARAAGLDTTGAPVFMFYDDPFTLPMNRRNEVAIELQ